MLPDGNHQWIYYVFDKKVFEEQSRDISLARGGKFFKILRSHVKQKFTRVMPNAEFRHFFNNKNWKRKYGPVSLQIFVILYLYKLIKLMLVRGRFSR